jgi:HAD superfamily hydrolase (TIGR01509 family)
VRQQRGGPDARAVVFDLDGVLVDSEHLWAEMWQRYAERHGVRWTIEHTRDCQGMSAPEWAAYLAREVGASHDPSVTERAVVDGIVEAVAGRRAPLLPGAAELVRGLSGHVPVGLATSAPRRVIDAVFDTHGIRGCFVGTVSSAEVGRGKPSPDVYLEAAARIDVEPTECVAVEDSSNGILSAAYAGMTVIAIPNVRYPLRPEARLAAAEITENLDQVRRIIWERLDLQQAGHS